MDLNSQGTIFAKTHTEMNRLLRIADQLARDYRMTWAPNKSFLLGEASTIPLGDGTLQVVEDTEYLGTTVNTNGLCTDKTRERIQNAKNQIDAIHGTGVPKRIPIRARCQVAQSLITPLMTWAVTPLENSDIEAIDTMEFRMWNPLRTLKSHQAQTRARHATGIMPAKVRALNEIGTYRHDIAVKVSVDAGDAC